VKVEAQAWRAREGQRLMSRERGQQLTVALLTLLLIYALKRVNITLGVIQMTGEWASYQRIRICDFRVIFWHDSAELLWHAAIPQC
jgi:mRNA-degrading endonuclease RelE of RelBE toxin-antitoxin system